MLQDIEVPPEKPNRDYYDDYCKLYIVNYILMDKFNELRKENRDLLEKYKAFEVK